MDSYIKIELNSIKPKKMKELLELIEEAMIDLSECGTGFAWGIVIPTKDDKKLYG